MLGYYRLALAMGVVIAHGRLIPDSVARTMVAAFFVISGYIISLTLTKNYRSNPLPFYWNRILRIYPLHIIVSAALVGLWAAEAADAIELTWIFRGDAEPGDAEVIRSFFLTRDDADLFNPPAWSLFYELAFYLVAPLLLIARGGVLGVASAVALSTLAVRGELGLLDDPLGFDPASGGPIALVSLYFLLGVAVFHIRERWPQPFGDRSRQVEAAALAALVLMLALSFKWVIDDDLGQFQSNFGSQVHVTTLVVTVVLLLAWERDRGLARRAADLTYPVYLLHWPILYLLVDQQPHTANLAEWLGDRTVGVFDALTGDAEASALVMRAALGAGATIALSQLWLWIEEPTFRRLRTAHRRRSTVSAPAERATTAATPDRVEPAASVSGP